MNYEEITKILDALKETEFQHLRTYLKKGQAYLFTSQYKPMAAFKNFYLDDEVSYLQVYEIHIDKKGKITFVTKKSEEASPVIYQHYDILVGYTTHLIDVMGRELRQAAEEYCKNNPINYNLK